MGKFDLYVYLMDHLGEYRNITRNAEAWEEVCRAESQLSRELGRVASLLGYDPNIMLSIAKSIDRHERKTGKVLRHIPDTFPERLHSTSLTVGLMASIW